MSSSARTRPTRIRLRPWQSEALDRFSVHDSPNFLAVATPGAGKTTFALTAATQHLADNPGTGLIVVAPTQHLKYQWSDAALRFGLHLEPDWSARDGELPKDMHGIVTTYQQVATSAHELSRLSRGAFVVLDEIHHAGDDRTWGTSILTAFEGAARRLTLSGTPFRSDTSAIPFVNYHLEEAQSDYEYGYGEALQDGSVVRPIYFPRINGFMEWVAPDGSSVAATFEDELPRELANQRLRTAFSLDGEWLPTVLDQANERLLAMRRTHPEAGGLVIATDQQHARDIAELMRAKHGISPVVAVSEDAQASQKIQAFADSDAPWIIAVRMISEGVDIPRLRLAVFATTTTTELFFRQAVGRVVRWTRGVKNQRAYFFIPDDPRLRHYANTLSEQRKHSLKKRKTADDAPSIELDDPLGEQLGDEEQLSLFEVIGSVALGSNESSESDEDDEDVGVFGDDDTAEMSDLDLGVDLVLIPPPLPSGGSLANLGTHRLGFGGLGGLGGDDEDDANGNHFVDLRRRKLVLRDSNADLARDLVRVTGQSHQSINTELNRLAGIKKISEATLDQLERRLKEGRAWLKRH